VRLSARGHPNIPPGCPRRLKVRDVDAVDVHMGDVQPVIAAIAEEWPPFGLTEEPLPGGLVVAVSGEVDLATAPELRERLGAAVDSGVTRIVVDLREVTFMDSIGLAAVVHARSRLGADSRLALVVAPDSYAELVLEIAGMPRAFAIFADREAAIAHVRG
jgi:anti-sigma B factor antagonist